MKLVQLYKQIKEESKVLVPRRTPEEREKNFLIASNKKIQEYIKNGARGDLDLSNAPITSLPNSLTRIRGSLILTESKITSLPNGLTVEGNLYLEGTPIAKLPNDLRVMEDLHLEDTQINSLPYDLKVEGWLWLFNTPVSKRYTKSELIFTSPGIQGRILYT
jgi:hypothetical protein